MTKDLARKKRIGRAVKSTSLLVAVFALTMAYNACSEFVTQPLDQSSTSLSSSPFKCVASDIGRDEQRNRRLTKKEVLSSLAAIFGDDVMSTSAVAATIAAIPQDLPFTQENEFDNRITDVEGLFAVAEAVADAVVASSAIATRVLGCAPATAGCQASVPDKLGLQLYRRPLTQEEKTSMTTFMTGLGGAEGVRLGIARLILSPNFLNIVEETNDVVDQSRARLSQYEVATRLAFRLTGATPDKTLLDAAGANQLGTLDEVRAHAARLVDSSSGRKQVRSIVAGWLGIGASLGDPHPNVAKGLGIDPNGFGGESYDEFFKFVDEIVFARNGTFHDLMTDKTAFATTPRLAKIYGVAQSSAPQKLTDARGGVLLRSATLLSSKAYSDPIMRGAYIRRQVLCQTIPFPSVAVVAERDAELQKIDHVAQSNRQIVNGLTGSSRCIGCHNLINPIGYALESFGAAGELRSREDVYDANGAIVASHVINSSVEDLFLGGTIKTSANGPDDLANAVSNGEMGRSCFTKQVFALSRMRFPTENDGCALSQVRAALIEGKSVKDSIIENIATEDIFWRGLAN